MFSIFRRRRPPSTPPAGPPSAPGLDAIRAAFGRLYPGQQPKSWTQPGVYRMHDLRSPPENPLDGVLLYDAGTHWHLVSLGLSDLYEKTSTGPLSGLGHELTFRLAKRDPAEAPPRWPIPMLVALARAELSGDVLGHGHTIKTGQAGSQGGTAPAALLVVNDPELAPIETPHGTVAFLQLVGVDPQDRERAIARGADEVVDELRSRDPLFVTRV